MPCRYVVDAFPEDVGVKRLLRAILLSAAAFMCVPVQATPTPIWADRKPADLATIDDDVARNIVREHFFDGINISEMRFSENGFDWHLLRFASIDKPDGPIWVVPHDDENAAFDAMISAVQTYGGTGIAVNSGPGGARRQSGDGYCGVRPARVTNCDPNRNFDSGAPIFTAAFVALFQADKPVIALHTNSIGFSGDGAGGRGDITIYDRAAFVRGEIKAARNGQLAVNPLPEMANPDTFALSAFMEASGTPPAKDVACGNAMTRSGVHFWHEPVRASDGSLSNYLILNRPDIAYVNAESRLEVDLALAASRHAIMIKSYLENCAASGDKPAAQP